MTGHGEKPKCILDQDTFLLSEYILDFFFVLKPVHVSSWDAVCSGGIARLLKKPNKSAELETATLAPVE